MPKKARRFSRETKLAAVQRMLGGESATALSRELNILRKDLYKWRADFVSGGAAALRKPGRPNATRTYAGPHTEQRIAELEERLRRQENEIESIRSLLPQAGEEADHDGKLSTNKPHAAHHGTK